jgi:hypothetical protein
MTVKGDDRRRFGAAGLPPAAPLFPAAHPAWAKGAAKPHRTPLDGLWRIQATTLAAARQKPIHERIFRPGVDAGTGWQGEI